MRKFVLFVCACALLFPSLTPAQTSTSNKSVADANLPGFLVAGFNAYRDKGPEEAVQAWIKGSPLDGSRDALSQANILRQIQDFYGAYQSFEVISTRDLSQRTQVLYLELDYEKGPLFAKFVSYKSAQGWILTSFLFNTKEELIIPTK